jgi:hypothetical protein
VTGSYQGSFHIYDRTGKVDIPLEASRTPLAKKKPTPIKSKLSLGSKLKKDPKKFSLTSPADLFRDDADPVDMSKKVLHVSLHPTQNLLAASCANCVYLFHADGQR